MLVLDELSKVERVVSLLLGGHDEGFAVVEGHTDVLQGGIERDSGHAEHAVGIGQHGVGKDIGGMAIEIIANTGVAKHHALGATCRTTGIDEIGQSLTPESVS